MLERPFEITYDSDYYDDYADFRNTQWITDAAPTAIINNLYTGKGIICIPADANGNVNVHLRYMCHCEARGRTVSPIGTLEEPRPLEAQTIFARVSGVLRTLGPYVPSPETMAKAAMYISRIRAGAHYQTPMIVN